MKKSIYETSVVSTDVLNTKWYIREVIESQNGLVGTWKWPQRSSNSTFPAMGVPGTPSIRPGCSETHPAWCWTLMCDHSFLLTKANEAMILIPGQRCRRVFFMLSLGIVTTALPYVEITQLLLLFYWPSGLLLLGTSSLARVHWGTFHFKLHCWNLEQ